MIYTCPKCFEKVEGRSSYCNEDEDCYVTLNPHVDLKGDHCSPFPYNVITGKKRPIRGLVSIETKKTLK